MVRRKVEIKKIEDKAKRHTTFTKRRQGLFKKARDLSSKSGDQIAIVTFSLAGNMYAFGHPSVAPIVKRYVQHDHHADVVEDSEEEEEEEEEVEVEGVEELEKLEKEVAEMIKKVSQIAEYMSKKM